MADSDRDDGYFEIQLDRGTVALAGLGVVALLVLAFLLGSWWGRSEPESAPGQPAPVAAELGGEPGRDSGALEEEDVDGDPLFGATAVTARGALPVGPTPSEPTAGAMPPGPDRAVSAPAASSPAARPAAGPTTKPTPKQTRKQTATPTTKQSGTAAVAPATSSGSGWVVQVAALKERQEADALSRKLTAKGYSVRIQEEAGFHKVQVGPFTSKSEAEGVERRLKAEEKLATWIHRG